MVHVALAVFERDRVEHLLHAGHAERHDRKHLRLAALEETVTVRRGQHAGLGRERPEIGGTTTVDANAFVDDAAARDFLLQGAERTLHRSAFAGELARDLVGADEADEQVVLDLVEPVVAIVLVGDRHRFGGLDLGVLRHRREHLGRVVDVGRVRDVGDRTVREHVLGVQLDLQIDGRADPLLRRFEALGDQLFGDLRRALFVELPGALGAAGLDHHDRDVTVVETTTGNHDLERALVALLEGGVRDPLALVVREPHRADRDR